jgi:NAD dependent epimerase/dehydratase family enzyme
VSNKNIIVVGGTGLIGNSVLGYLSKKKPKIFALTRNKIPNKPENVEEVFFDLEEN